MAGYTAIEKYLVDMINQKYAKRVFQRMNTEWERLTLEFGNQTGKSEYEWMVNKALAIHREMNVGGASEKETEDTVGDSGSDEA